MAKPPKEDFEHDVVAELKLLRIAAQTLAVQIPAAIGLLNDSLTAKLVSVGLSVDGLAESVDSAASAVEVGFSSQEAQLGDILAQLTRIADTLAPPKKATDLGGAATAIPKGSPFPPQ